MGGSYLPLSGTLAVVLLCPFLSLSQFSVVRFPNCNNQVYIGKLEVKMRKLQRDATEGTITSNCIHENSNKQGSYIYTQSTMIYIYTQ